MSNDQVTLVPNQGWDKRILVCRCGPLVDTFIIVSQNYVILVDTLINQATGEALLEIARPHLEGRQLLAINTHADWDHAWGNHVFASRAVPIIAQRLCAERLRDDSAARLKEMQEREPGRFDDVALTPPTILFDERLTIDGSDLTLELFGTPGHAPDHISIYIPEIGTLLAGDAAEAPFPFARGPETLPVLRASLAAMAAREPATVLYCHAPVTSGPELLQHNIGYFNTLEARCRAALTRGAEANPAEDADLETLVQFPFEQAAPPGFDVSQPQFYRPGHQAHIRMMLAFLTK